MLFFFTFYSLKNPETNVSLFSQKYKAAQLFPNVLTIKKKKKKTRM